MQKYVCKECGKTPHDISCRPETESRMNIPFDVHSHQNPKQAHFIELEDD